MRRFSLAVLLVLGSACDKSNGEQAAQPQNNLPQEGIGDSVYVTRETTLFLSPTPDAQVPHPSAGTDLMINNGLGILSRGKQGTVLQILPGWTQVRLVDDALGWIPSDALMPVKAARGEATLHDPTPYFADASTPLGMGVAQPGSLLYILEAGKPRTKVQLERVGPVYVPTANLIEDDGEVEMSHIIVHSRTNAQIGDVTEVSEDLDEARIEHANSPLVGVIAEQVDFMNMHPTPYKGTSHMMNAPFYRSFPMRE